MRRIIVALLLTVLGALAASGAGERDITLAEGQTLKFFPARALMTGVTLESGADCVDLQRVGALVILRGLKAGEADARISLRGGESLPMHIHVLQNTFSHRKPAAAADKPKWGGHYELRIPEDRFRVVYYDFDAGEADKLHYVARIGNEVYASSFYIDDEEGKPIDVVELYDYDKRFGYSGGLDGDGSYKLFYGEGNAISPENERDARDWFAEYAPDPATTTMHGYCMPLLDFGWVYQGDDDAFERGIVLQRMTQLGRPQSFLERFYQGKEKICGIDCWVFDFRGQGVYGLGDSCWWVDPATGLALQRIDADGAGFTVIDLDLDYGVWDSETRPDRF